MGAETQNPNNNLDAVFHVLHAGNGSGLPSVQEMDAWVTTYGLQNATLAGKNAQDTLAALQQRECTFVVETEGMTIQWKSCSCTNGACEPSIVPGLQELATALGN